MLTEKIMGTAFLKGKYNSCCTDKGFVLPWTIFPLYVCICLGISCDCGRSPWKCSGMIRQKRKELYAEGFTFKSRIWFFFSFDGFSGDGCYVDPLRSNSKDTVCRCNHLTHFAVLVDFRGDAEVFFFFLRYFTFNK